MDRIPESDWKKLRALKDHLLDVACERILVKAQGVISDRSEGSYAAYLALWQLLNTEDGAIALMFDDFRRSTAISKLVAWKRYGLISDAELAELREETQETVRALADIPR